MAIIRTTVLKCDECSHAKWMLPSFTDQDIQDEALNSGWYFTKNGTSWCRQCASANKREGD